MRRRKSRSSLPTCHPLEPRRLLTTLTVADISVAENASAAIFRITGSPAPEQDLILSVATKPGTAKPGKDYLPLRTKVTLPAGTTSLDVPVTLRPVDGLYEGDENFTLEIAAPSPAAPTRLSATATIVDGDSAPVLTASGTTVDEPAARKAFANVTFNLPAAVAKPVSFSYSTSDGTAAAGKDYAASTGKVTFRPGQTQRTVRLYILADSAEETDETFNLNLTGLTNTAGPAQVQVTIRGSLELSPLTSNVPAQPPPLIGTGNPFRPNGPDGATDKFLTGDYNLDGKITPDDDYALWSIGTRNLPDYSITPTLRDRDYILATNTLPDLAIHAIDSHPELTYRFDPGVYTVGTSSLQPTPTDLPEHHASDFVFTGSGSLFVSGPVTGGSSLDLSGVAAQTINVSNGVLTIVTPPQPLTLPYLDLSDPAFRLVGTRTDYPWTPGTVTIFIVPAPDPTQSETITDTNPDPATETVPADGDSSDATPPSQPATAPTEDTPTDVAPALANSGDPETPDPTTATIPPAKVYELDRTKYAALQQQLFPGSTAPLDYLFLTFASPDNATIPAGTPIVRYTWVGDSNLDAQTTLQTITHLLNTTYSGSTFATFGALISPTIATPLLVPPPAAGTLTVRTDGIVITVPTPDNLPATNPTPTPADTDAPPASTLSETSN